MGLGERQMVVVEVDGAEARDDAVLTDSFRNNAAKDSASAVARRELQSSRRELSLAGRERA